MRERKCARTAAGDDAASIFVRFGRPAFVERAKAPNGEPLGVVSMPSFPRFTLKLALKRFSEKLALKGEDPTRNWHPPLRSRRSGGPRSDPSARAKASSFRSAWARVWG